MNDQTTKPETSLVPQPSVNELPASPQDVAARELLAGGDSMPAIDNFGENPQERFRLHAIAREEEAIPLDSMIGQEVACKFFVIHGVERVIEGGEVEQFARCAIIDDEGLVYQCCSTGVASMLFHAARTFGWQAFDPVMRFKVKQTRTSRGFKRMSLVPIFD